MPLLLSRSAAFSLLVAFVAVPPSFTAAAFDPDLFPFNSCSVTVTFLPRWKSLCTNILSSMSIAISREGSRGCVPLANFDSMRASSALEEVKYSTLWFRNLVLLVGTFRRSQVATLYSSFEGFSTSCSAPPGPVYSWREIGERMRWNVQIRILANSH